MWLAISDKKTSFWATKDINTRGGGSSEISGKMEG